ncbi:MSHA pilin protein MshD [Marinobacter persicus]|uniref:MSHA pilin protein MshD n=1 Tax=Marinobacter persicus TaxID=930118 RepID=A0A1I3XBN2_9GAMM|nr:type II secretion system protein [Marinobacter persicus]GHD48976.1 MSHA biogenesis protein MshD [Marinobacter persicus]SFK16769.1 MSHA pilin protein MshD [Marinobacter persicus]
MAKLSWSPKQEQGATLVELVMTIVIISVAIAGVVGAFSLIVGRSADPLNHTRAVELAQLYMDEIITRKYDHDAPQGGVPRYNGDCNIATEEGAGNRALFNDVDDYDGLEDSPPADARGTLDGYNSFTVEVEVNCDADGVDLLAGQAKRIDLTITAPGDQTFSFTAYKANF